MTSEHIDTTVLATLPKHTELVSAADGRHTRELSDYHNWLPAEQASEGAETERRRTRRGRTVRGS